MRRCLVLAAVLCLLVVFAAGRIMAHEEEWNASFSTLDSQVFIHDDAEPFKGYAKLFAYNDTGEYWTDFHFQVKSVNGSDISAVIFVDGIQDTIDCDPTSSQSGLTWTIFNDPAGSIINLYFAADPVAPGEEAWFKIYTDNTVDKVRFGLCAYPTTVVPEPGSLLALFSGIVGFGGLALRRKR